MKNDFAFQSKRLISTVFYAAVIGIAAHDAQAATELTIYGVADVYVASQKGDRSEFKIDSGGLSGSRLGFSAEHELASGLKARARLEAGIAQDAGTSTQGGRTWGRQAWVGLSGGFGTVSLGRQYTPSFNALDNDDPFETGAGSAVSSGIVSVIGGVRADNSIAWALPKFGNAAVNLMYAAGEPSTGSRRNGSYFGASARYEGGPVGIGLTLGRQERANDAGVAATSVLLAGSYDFGPLSLMAGVQGVRNSTRAANAQDDRTEFFAGVHVPVGAGTVWAGAGAGRTRQVSGSHATQASLAYLHAMDKSTTVYAVASTLRNGNATAFTTDTATGSGPDISSGRRANQVLVGIRYKF